MGGHTGRLLCDLLARDGIAERFVRTEAETRCCVNVLEPSGRSTEFLEPGREVSGTEVGALLERIGELAAKADVITLSGSVPKSMAYDVYADLVGRVRAAGKPCILDTSGTLLEQGIRALPTMVKPNADEIGQVLGRSVSGVDEICAAARELHDRGIEQVVVSLGGDGAVMACAAGLFRGRAPRIEVVNPVGSGDTMVGAFAVAIARGLAPADQLAYAMSCASANCLSASTGRFDPSVAADLLAGTVIERIG